MKSKGLSIGIFILSIISLLISLKLFYNMGVYVDDYNTSPDIICGGKFWLYMDWLRLGISAIICVLVGINIFSRKNEKR